MFRKIIFSLLTKSVCGRIK